MKPVDSITPSAAPERLVEQVEGASALDGVIGAIRRAVQKVLPAGPVADLWHGTWLGHPLHPALSDVPVGAWLSAGILDALDAGSPQAGRGRAATTLVGVGLAAAVPTALSGAADWSEAGNRQQRLGLVHAAANSTGTLLYAGSLAARLAGRQRQGRMLGWAGLACAGLGAYLGGHLAYRSATGTNHAMPSWHRVPTDWTDLGRIDALPDRQLTRRSLGEVPVLVYRQESEVRVLVDQCAHLGGPLADGQVSEDSAGEPCVSCPWHGSTFRLRDGAVRRGPATSTQPVLDVRVLAGQVQARRPS